MHRELILPEMGSPLYPSMLLRKGTVYADGKQQLGVGREGLFFRSTTVCWRMLAKTQHKQVPKTELENLTFEYYKEMPFLFRRTTDSSPPLPLKRA